MSTLMVWGDDTAGQISGAPGGDFKAVVGGSINGLALRQDWTPVIWGSLPPGSPPLGAQPIDAGMATQKFHAVALGRDDAVLIRQGGTLAAFGRNASIKS